MQQLSATAAAVAARQPEMEWFIEDRNCFVLKRVKEAGSFRKRQAKK
jgi:hypothetical protein